MINYAVCAVPVPLKTEFIYTFDNEVQKIQEGIRVMVPFGGRTVRAYVVKVLTEKPDVQFELKPIKRIIDKSPVFGQNEWKLALWMEKFYFSSRGEVIDTMIPGGKRDIVFGGIDTDLALNRTEVQLTEQQQNAINTVMNGTDKMYYLYGITGSGKTEVFLNCAKQIIDSGGQVIYLVPEITLTHQLARLVLKRFENNVAILHSGLTDAQRITQWRRIKNGEVGLVIGARSAVFAPCDKLKMIIIDEEHENSYKSGNSPRYHARQVAQKRIAECDGKLLMGSATPSLEAWSMMQDSSKITRINLTTRVGGGSVPRVTVADIRNEQGIFGVVLQEKMNKILSQGKQVILFLNRRGFSYYFHCRTCGFELKCPHCDVAMTYHKKNSELVCHYCGYRQKPIKICPDCGSLDVMYSGFGTEQVESKIKKLFPQYNCARLDTDTVSSDKTVIQKTLNDFQDGKIQILLGTQMVAKGLNFPNVRLVGIIMADSGLLIPDFRAEERTFDLLVQVSGRSGRADSQGEVVVQTRMPENPAIDYAADFRCDEFFDDQLKSREATGFPPYSRMINIVCRSKNKLNAMKVSEQIASSLRENKGNPELLGRFGYEVFGSQECPIEKIRENWRFQTVIRSKSVQVLINTLHETISKIKVPASVVVEIDVDPVSLL